MPTETQWRAALSLLYEASGEINSCDMMARGSYWFGNPLADRIDEFLKSIDQKSIVNEQLASEK